MATKSSRSLTLKDRLSRLKPEQASKLLGPDGARLISEGAKVDIDIATQVTLTAKQFRLTFFSGVSPKRNAVVTLKLADNKSKRLKIYSTPCRQEDLFKGAALSFILEEKLALGLAIAPKDEKPWELLNEDELVAYALEQRAQRAVEEKMRIQSQDKSTPWADYLVTNRESGKTYRTALRSLNKGDSYCSCLDFKTNRLGTCKHLLKIESYVKRKFSKAALTQPFKQRQFAIAVDYQTTTSLRLLGPDIKKATPTLLREIRILKGTLIHSAKDIHRLLKVVRKLEQSGREVIIYPDAEEFIQQALVLERLQKKVEEIRKNPAKHPLRKTLLKTELLPYQLDGIAFAAGAGRSILADEMGLGKTIQGIGLAEYLRRESDVKKVLVICPASLKAQWKNEIERFSNLDAQLILGPIADRSQQYDNECFFTICNYEQVLKDILAIESSSWDLIILDEGQRIKNWEAKTSRIIKGLKSTFALVLSGTPMENRLDELYSVVQFIDDSRLAPAFRFFNQHRVVDEKGKVTGFKNLDHLRAKIEPIVLRRTRDAVMKELPPRTTQILRIPPTDEQLELHSTHMQTVSAISRKAHLTEMDVIRMQKALLMCRLSANSTFLVTKQKPGFSSKLKKLNELIEQLNSEDNRKVILFSEWTRMLDLVEEQLAAHRIKFVRLDGQVPQKKRQQLVKQFQSDADCKFIIMTNAGSTGLNLQSANTVINVDLPWNPAILEQRIARAHRMGQKQPVQVYILVTEETIEDSLLNTLSAKKELALAALDIESSTNSVALESSMEEIKRRLEILIGAKPDAPLDESEKIQETEKLKARKIQLAESGGQLMTAAFQFLDSSLPEISTENHEINALQQHFEEGLNQCLTRDEQGQPTIQFTLPNKDAVSQLATTFAKFASLAKINSSS